MGHQGEPPFAIAQGTVLVAFVALGLLALRRFRPTADEAGIDVPEEDAAY